MKLTPRETEVHELVIVNSRTVPLVAEWLGIAESTVREHVKRIRRKMRDDGITPPDNRRHFLSAR